jgi:hypothetical protein
VIPADLPDRLLGAAGRRPDELVATLAEARALAHDVLGRVGPGGVPAPAARPT